MSNTARTKRWVLRIGELDDTGYERFVREGVMQTVREDTNSKYIGACARFMAFIDMRGLPFSEDAFVRFLHACRKQGASGQSLEGYRAAILWVQRAFQVEPWAASPTLMRALKGYKDRHFYISLRCCCLPQSESCCFCSFFFFSLSKPLPKE